MAAANGRSVAENVRVTPAVRLQESWRWRLEEVEGTEERLVLFNHAGAGAWDRDERVEGQRPVEVRAAIMYTSFGMGLFFEKID